MSDDNKTERPLEERFETVDTTAKIHNGDAALQFLNNSVVAEMTPEDEKKLVRKIDWMIIPLMFMCYFLQYTDKILINYANIMGLQKDTAISGDQFSQLALLFYVTYLAFEFPTGYLMQRLPTAKYLGANVTLWGLMIACTSAAHDWGGLASLRVLLGCFESAVAPALIIITTMWYKKTEQPKRLGFWYVGTAIGKMVGAITSFGFQHYEGTTFKSWQIMFLVFGVVTIAVGITVMFVMPDNPMSSRLSQEEKVWAIERLRSNRTGIENKHFKRHQVWECLRDPQTWLLSLLVILSNIPNGFVSSFQATVIKSFGFTSEVTSLLSIPTGFIDALCTLGATWCASRYNKRSPLIISIFAASCLGSCLLAFLPAGGYVGGKMFGSYAASLIGSGLPLMYSLAGANFAGHTKKVTMNAILLMSFCVGNIIGPLTFRDQDKPRYIPAKIAMVVSTAGAAVTLGCLVLYYKWENRRRDRLYANQDHTEDSEFLDLTDRENREFRYVI